MKEQIRTKCELLTKNRTSIADKFMFENGLMSVAAGLIYTEADKEADVDRLAACRKILKNSTGVFSTFRKTVELALLSKMALSENPEKYLSDVKTVYEKVRDGKIMDNSYMILSSILICDQGKQDSADEIIARYNEIMKRMNKEHPVLTTSEDISYAMLLALSGRDIDAIISDMEECSNYLKKTCKMKADSNSIQGLSEVLALTDGDIKAKCDKVFTIFNTFADRKADFGTKYELSALGALTDIHIDTDALVDEIIEVEGFLKESKGFQKSSMDREKRLMFATLLVAQNYRQESSVISNSLISSTLEIIKTNQVSMMISVATSLASPLAQLLEAATKSSEDKSDHESDTTGK